MSTYNPLVPRPEQDPFQARVFYRYLRLCDVSDALDALGFHDIYLMDSKVRPLWLGMKFWGVATTVRVLPAHRHMRYPLTKEEAVAVHKHWFDEVGRMDTLSSVREGSVLVMEADNTRETGIWGSENTMAVLERGGVGIVTDGWCRDTYEVELEKMPVACAGRARTIIPGRVLFAEHDGPINCGGVLVRPGDLVGCDNDGVVVVPQEHLLTVAAYAAAILLADMKARRVRYQRLGLPADPTVDIETVEAYYQKLGAL